MKKRMEKILKRLLSILFRDIMALTFSFFLILPTAPAIGQDQLPLSFVPVAPEQLSNSSVHCFFKDSHGYMWIGTEDEGLIRYDGTNAYRYLHDTKDRASLPHSTVNTIAESPQHELWIGTARGLCIYNRELDNFINVDSIQGNRNYLNNRFITDLEFDTHGNIWIGTHEGGINIYDPAKHEFSYIVDKAQGGILPSTNFINVLLNNGETMWCGSKGGLQLYDARTKKRIVIDSRHPFQNTQITSIAPDKYQNLWIATIDGQIIRTATSGNIHSFTQVISGEPFADRSSAIVTLCFDRNGNILAGGEDSGLSYIDRETHRVKAMLSKEDNTRYLPTNSIQALYVDDLGYIWIGTPTHGAFVFDSIKKKFVSNDALESPFRKSEVRSFAEDRDGDIWIAFYGAGLGKLNSKTGALEHADKINRKLSSKNVTSVICSKRDLWIGTAGKGVFKINVDNQKSVNYQLASDGFGNNQVFCLYEDRKGTVWAGTWGSGLFFFDKVTQKFVNATEYDQPNHIPNTAYVTQILEDSAGTFWVATLYGLYELKRKEGNTFTYRLHVPDEREGSILGSQVHTIAEDQHQNLWIGTNEGLSLKKRDSAAFTLFKMQTASGVNTIRSVVPDNLGNVWIGGSIGLSKFDLKTKTFVNYTHDDGLKANNFQRNAALAAKSGKLFFGSNNGFDSFFPENIAVTSWNRPVILTDLKINNQSVKPGAADSPLKRQISMTSDLVLSYDQRSFVIDFAVLDPGQPAHYTYCYRLDGFDEGWNCFGPNNSATYTNINPGHYVFMVKAANRDGTWTEKPLTLDITIEQVVWKRWWAFSIYFALLVLFIYILIKVRVERLKMKNEIMLEKLKREQEHELSESKNQFFTNIAHEFRTPLSLILLPLETLVDAEEIPKRLHQRVLTAYKNADRMKRLVNELLDFNKLEAGNLQLQVRYVELVRFIIDTSSSFNEMAQKRSIKFSITSEAKAITGWLDPDKLERVIFNVLSNAFKFTADNGEIGVWALVRKRRSIRTAVCVGALLLWLRTTASESCRKNFHGCSINFIRRNLPLRYQVPERG
jgi:ligand-binding sensor domain-containing protein